MCLPQKWGCTAHQSNLLMSWACARLQVTLSLISRLSHKNAKCIGRCGGMEEERRRKRLPWESQAKCGAHQGGVKIHRSAQFLVKICRSG